MSQASEDKPKALSKKELNKLARKEKKHAPPGNKTATEAASKYSILFNKASAPIITRAVELFLGEAGVVKYCINKGAEVHLPLLFQEAGLDGAAAVVSGSLSGDVNIARLLVRSNAAKASELYGDGDPWLASQVDQWLDVCSRSSVGTQKEQLLQLVNRHVADKTFLVGESVSLADIAMYASVTRVASSNPSATATVPLDVDALLPAYPHVSRWYQLIVSHLPETATTATAAIPISFSAAAAAIAATVSGNPSSQAGNVSGKDSSGKASTSDSTVAKKDTQAVTAAGVVVEEAHGGALPHLEGAEDGKVCTRFPPEPSGYLHIGHAKACLLNQYYAQRYKGKLIVRFDDTNPSKEKEEFQENILKDLETLGIRPDMVSHSSDHFATCEKVARKMIEEGKAYMDNTDQETMQAERLAREESKCRNTSPKDNLALFERLLKGEKEVADTYCLRAKIDMKSLNGTMRDPVLYRANNTPHHRTGTKYKAYPTYDFACPLIDSVEGVTHALRTTEYLDRDEQYYWIQDAMGIRRVLIHSFGKMNFIHTVLSKRKLTWFVDQGLVEGWFDPRFPTIQGCVRRGMNVQALKSFILSQGASKRVVTMEWDKFWSDNRKVLEESAFRYMGVTKTDSVELTITNVSDKITAHTVPLHPQKPELGTRVMRRYCRVLIDQVDAVTYELGEEVTLLRWGNVTITDIQSDGSKVLSMKATHDPAATNFSKTKKATWVASIPDLVPCKIVEYDHLISKAKILDEENFQDFVNSNSKTESDALCDPCLRKVTAGTVLQLERKGFYRCDKPYGGSADKPAVLFFIPDGKPKAGSAAPANNAVAKKNKK